MAIPGISLGTDALGQGAMFESIFGRADVPGCGKRPLLPGKSRREYDDCVRRQQEINAMNQPIQSRMLNSNSSNTGNTTTYVLIGITILVIAFLIFRKK